MDGVSSRLGRTSSRYGSAPAFTGPVRKWKKQWVSCQPKNNSNQRGNGNANSQPTLLLCRWTPLSPSSDDSAVPEEPPKRKFRYTPIVPLADKKRNVEAAKAVKTTQETAMLETVGDDVSDKGNSDGETFIDDIQDSSKAELGLDLSLKASNSNQDLSTEDYQKRIFW